jgi:glycosyltransferase involved in cell wall biosynthesis
LRIGVDASCWVNGRGYGRFTRELLRVMVSESPSDEFICFADARAAERFDLAAPNVRLVRVELGESPTEAAAADGYRSPGDLLRFTRAVWRERPDVFLSPSVYTYFPIPPGTPVAVVIHDAIPERFPELTLPSRRARLFWWGKVKLALAQARIVLTVSRYSAGELESVLGVERDRIRVVMPAPSASYQPEPESVAIAAACELGVPAGERWFTYVGGFNPHKRVDALVRAHALLIAGGGPRAHLLLVGSLTEDVFHGNVAEIREAIASSGTSGLVHWTGFLADEQLRCLHSGATALMLVSAAEGFGLPAVEAAACGTPAIATRESPLPEVLAGGGIFVDPNDEAAIAAAMRQLLETPGLRRTMGDEARRAARRLSWTDGARVALDALHEASSGTFTFAK